MCEAAPRTWLVLASSAQWQGVKSKGKKLLKMHNALYSILLFCSRSAVMLLSS